MQGDANLRVEQYFDGPVRLRTYGMFGILRQSAFSNIAERLTVLRVCSFHQNLNELTCLLDLALVRYDSTDVLQFALSVQGLNRHRDPFL